MTNAADRIAESTDEQARDLYWEAAGATDSSFADAVREALWDRKVGEMGRAEFDAWMDYRT